MNKSAEVINMNDRITLGASIKMPELEKAIGELCDLFAMKQAAGKAFTDGVRRISEQSNIDPHVIKTYVAAIMNDKLAQLHARAEQLSIVFEEGPGQ